MTPRYLLGLDLGTSGCKSVLLDQAGTVTWSAGPFTYLTYHPHPGWSEQNPEDWLGAAQECIRQLMRQSGVVGSEIIAVGLSGQMHTLVCGDSQGAALRPAILWSDQRSQTQVAQVYEHAGSQQLAAWTGNPLATGFMLPSWLWLRQHEPETNLRTRFLLLPKDFLRFSMTGKPGSEPSDAGSTGMFDPVSGQWSLPLLELLEVDPGLLPEIFPSAAMAGELSAFWAQSTGLLQGTPVIYGGADQALQALANGITQPGRYASTIGTGGQVIHTTLQPHPNPSLGLHLYNHVLPGRWYQMAAILSAGSSLEWLARLIGHPGEVHWLADLAAEAPPGAGGMVFIPHLAGERTPYMDPALTGAFSGLRQEHGIPHLARAVMEGVVMALRQGLDLLRAHGPAPERILAAGGAQRHPLWIQLQADIYGMPVVLAQGLEASATGAAHLAGIGMGVFRDLVNVGWDYEHPSGQLVRPDAGRSAVYADLYGRFLATIHSLAEVNQVRAGGTPG